MGLEREDSEEKYNIPRADQPARFHNVCEISVAISDVVLQELTDATDGSLGKDPPLGHFELG